MNIRTHHSHTGPWNSSPLLLERVKPLSIQGPPCLSPQPHLSPLSSLNSGFQFDLPTASQMHHTFLSLSIVARCLCPKPTNTSTSGSPSCIISTYYLSPSWRCTLHPHTGLGLFHLTPKASTLDLIILTQCYLEFPTKLQALKGQGSYLWPIHCCFHSSNHSAPHMVNMR